MKAIMIGSNVKRPIEDGMRDTRDSWLTRAGLTPWE